MDLRKWFLLQDRPASTDRWFSDLTKHTPCSLYRSPRVLQLWQAGYYTNFMLTDEDGQPTIALELMAKLMGAELCLASELPDEERKKLFKDNEKALINVLCKTWCLRGITDRVKSAISNMNTWSTTWVGDFLTRLDGVYIWYKDPDGKRRKRVCYIATCPPAWEMTDYVYEGLYKWVYDHHGPSGPSLWGPAERWPDAYQLLRSNPSLRCYPSQGTDGRHVQELRAATGTCLPGIVLGSQVGTAGRPVPAGCDLSPVGVSYDRSCPASP